MNDIVELLRLDAPAPRPQSIAFDGTHLAVGAPATGSNGATPDSSARSRREAAIEPSPPAISPNPAVMPLPLSTKRKIAPRVDPSAMRSANSRFLSITAYAITA